MKYTLDTLPVLDAYKADCECPLCRLHTLCEDQYVDSMLNSAYMEPDWRVRTNQTGFCTRHFQQMYSRRNRLGLALMTHTHMHEVIASMRQILEEDASRCGALAFLSGRKKEDGKPEKIHKRMDGCVLCEQIDDSLARYAYTIAHLYTTNGDFKTQFEQSKGFCLPHLALVMQTAEKTLSSSDYARFEKALTALELYNLDRIEQELERFTLMFDYRNVGKPFGSSYDAVERSINKLMGACVGKEAQRPSHND